MVIGRRLRRASLVGLIAALMGATHGWAQTGKTTATTDPLSGLRVGQWIMAVGTARGVPPLPCTSLKQLAGDFLDDDWALKGMVVSIDTLKQEFVIGGCRVRVTDDTIYGTHRGLFRSFAEVRPGMLIDVEGTFLQGGTLLAAELDDESDELRRQPARKDLVEVVGRIHRVDARRRVVTVMGIEFGVTEKTKVRSAIQ